jgi:hypothetical protein
MANLRIVHDNAADRAAIVASSTAGGLVVANVQNDLKGLIHRSTGTAVTYKLTWADFETVGCVALPACSLSTTGTMRIRAYDAAAGGNLLADTGAQYACPGAPLGLWDWTMPLNANAFLYGGAAKAAIWFSHVAAKRVEIDLSDPDNSADYLDVARIVAGGFFEADYNPAYGAGLQLIDTTKTTRAQSGDLRVDRGTMHDSLRLDLAWLSRADAARLWQILQGNGLFRSLFVSLYPGGDDPPAEQRGMVYGKLKQLGGISHIHPELFSSQIDIEGW